MFVMLNLVIGSIRMDARLPTFLRILRMATVASRWLGGCRYAEGR